MCEKVSIRAIGLYLPCGRTVLKVLAGLRAVRTQAGVRYITLEKTAYVESKSPHTIVSCLQFLADKRTIPGHAF